MEGISTLTLLFFYHIVLNHRFRLRLEWKVFQPSDNNFIGVNMKFPSPFGVEGISTSINEI